MCISKCWGPGSSACYTGSVSDIVHVLYSLTYFDDADPERMPRMLWDIDWRTIKKTIRQWVQETTD